MNKKIFLLVFACGFMQLKGADCFSVHPYGFIAGDLFYDTRQIFGLRDDFFLLWPEKVDDDPFCIDINARGQWHLTAIQTRLGLKSEVHGWADKAWLRAVVEGDFLGVAESLVVAYRMRHAYLEVIASPWTFLVGQYWHPLFVLDCFPDTISFNNGGPIEPISRDPQVRLTYTTDNFEGIVAASSQRDFSTTGPIGVSSDYIRNSVTPNFHGAMRFFPRDNTVVGIALDYLRIAPRIDSLTGYSVKEEVNSVIAQIYCGYNGPRFTLRSKVLYGENGSNHLLLSGFAVKTHDPITDKQTYAPTAVFSWWLDTAYWFYEQTHSFGLFAGYTKNLGSWDTLFIEPGTGQPLVFAIDPTIDYVARFAPRYRYKTDTFEVGVELEFTRAAYGRLTNKARVRDARPVNNVRLLFESLYKF